MNLYSNAPFSLLLYFCPGQKAVDTKNCNTKRQSRALKNIIIKIEMDFKTWFSSMTIFLANLP